MPELRQDAVTGRWVVVATERAMRPSDLARVRSVEIEGPENCPFCPGNERMTPHELYAIRAGGSAPDGPGWSVRVVPNKFPAFKHCEAAAGSNGLFQRRAAEGTHEVIIHSPDHNLSLAEMSEKDAESVFKVYRERYGANRMDPDVDYIHLILNHGAEAGASLEHPHTQLFGVSLVPPLVELELCGTHGHKEKTGGCVFCEMIDNEMESGERVLAVTDRFTAIAPFASRFPFEVWIIPNDHKASFGDISDVETLSFTGILQDVLGKLHLKFNNPPLNCYIHTAPCDGGDYDYFHWHLECFPRVSTPGAFEWGTNMMINVITPEHAAEFLRS
ncbi:MAG: galactose-1-phosphate uridylyltransferase [Actinobacteria bacterium]|nr:galactose-1-phosphate uridylyltransferase [Actinomycetota bacterium]